MDSFPGNLTYVILSQKQVCIPSVCSHLNSSESFLQEFDVDALEKFVEETSIPTVTLFNKDPKHHPFVIKYFNSPNAKVHYYLIVSSYTKAGRYLIIRSWLWVIWFHPWKLTNKASIDWYLSTLIFHVWLIILRNLVSLISRIAIVIMLKSFSFSILSPVWCDTCIG